jgi:hypothetical protein
MAHKHYFTAVRGCAHERYFIALRGVHEHYFTRVRVGHTNLIVREFNFILLFVNIEVLFIYSLVTLSKGKVKKAKMLQLFIFKRDKYLHDHIARTCGRM